MFANIKNLGEKMADFRHPSAYEFVEYPGVEHGVDLGKGMECEPWFEKAVAFWEKNLVERAISEC